VPRENAAVKARRLLGEGRVDVRHRQGPELRAFVRGDSGEVHEAGHVRGSWYCSCAAYGRCSHMAALMLIATVVRPKEEA
jgi:uncharacterized Zn finger protein